MMPSFTFLFFVVLGACDVVSASHVTPVVLRAGEETFKEFLSAECARGELVTSVVDDFGFVLTAGDAGLLTGCDNEGTTPRFLIVRNFDLGFCCVGCSMEDGAVEAEDTTESRDRSLASVVVLVMLEVLSTTKPSSVVLESCCFERSTAEVCFGGVAWLGGSTTFVGVDWLPVW